MWLQAVVPLSTASTVRVTALILLIGINNLEWLATTLRGLLYTALTVGWL